LFLGRFCCFFEFFVPRGKSVPELIALNRSGCFIPAQLRLVLSDLCVNVPEHRLYSIFQFGFGLLNRAFPYKSVTTGCRFDLRSVYVLYLQADITKFSKQTDNIGKKSLDMAFKSFAPEVVYRTVVRHAVTRKPHEMDVLLKGLLDTTARINVIQIGIEQHLDH